MNSIVHLKTYLKEDQVFTSNVKRKHTASVLSLFILDIQMRNKNEKVGSIKGGKVVNDLEEMDYFSK